MQNDEIILRKTVVDDLDILFLFQLDEGARHSAAFTSAETMDKTAFINKYSKHLADPSIQMFTIIANYIIVGSIAKFEIEGDAEITYWIDKNTWGKGIATKALQHLLAIETTRPIFGRTAFDNTASQKVLEKCGFVKTGTDKGFAHARQMEIEEFIYKLE